MNIYFDMEFTHLGKTATPISLGAVTDNDVGFYGEFTDYDHCSISPWVYENVIENLWLLDEQDSTNTTLSFSDGTRYSTQRIKGRRYKVAARFLKWIHTLGEQYDTPIELNLISDVCYYDKVILDSIFSRDAINIPISSVCHDVNADIATYLGITEEDAFHINREEFAGIDTTTQKHNSLWDAHIIRKCYHRALDGIIPAFRKVSDDSETISIEYSPSVHEELYKLLMYLYAQMSIGHSFSVTTEGHTFDFDGDGSDTIYQLRTTHSPITHPETEVI